MKDTRIPQLVGTRGHAPHAHFWGWAPLQGAELRVPGWPQRSGLGPAISNEATRWGQSWWPPQRRAPSAPPESIIRPTRARRGMENPSIPFGKGLFMSEGL